MRLAETLPVGEPESVVSYAALVTRSHERKCSHNIQFTANGIVNGSHLHEEVDSVKVICKYNGL